MKIHLDKKESTEKTGLFSSAKVTEIYVKFELNDEELAIVNKHPDILKIKAMDYSYKNTDLSPSIKRLIANFMKPGDQGMRIVAYNSSELINYQNVINDTAKKLKDHIISLSGSGSGSSVTEI